MLYDEFLPAYTVLAQGPYSVCVRLCLNQDRQIRFIMKRKVYTLCEASVSTIWQKIDAINICSLYIIDTKSLTRNESNHSQVAWLYRDQMAALQPSYSTAFYRLQLSKWLL